MREGVSRKAFVRLKTLPGGGAAAPSVLAARGAGAYGGKADYGISVRSREERTDGRAEDRASDAQTIARGAAGNSREV